MTGDITTSTKLIVKSFIHDSKKSERVFQPLCINLCIVLKVRVWEFTRGSVNGITSLRPCKRHNTSPSISCGWSRAQVLKNNSQFDNSFEIPLNLASCRATKLVIEDYMAPEKKFRGSCLSSASIQSYCQFTDVTLLCSGSSKEDVLQRNSEKR